MQTLTPRFLRASVFALALAGSAAAFAQATPAGMWKTIDDHTGKARGLIEITEKDGVYSGRLVKSLSESSDGKVKVCARTRARTSRSLA